MGDAASEAMGVGELREKVARIIAALRSPSYEHDFEWHDPNGSYGTKPRKLLDEAADLLSLLPTGVDRGGSEEEQEVSPSRSVMNSSIPLEESFE